eukprot:scaffold2850_cov235-Pinguiococcus_pyrenoidosus.AAC.10
MHFSIIPKQHESELVLAGARSLGIPAGPHETIQSDLRSLRDSVRRPGNADSRWNMRMRVRCTVQVTHVFRGLVVPLYTADARLLQAVMQRIPDPIAKRNSQDLEGKWKIPDQSRQLRPGLQHSTAFH